MKALPLLFVFLAVIGYQLSDRAGEAPATRKTNSDKSSAKSSEGSSGKPAPGGNAGRQRIESKPSAGAGARGKTEADRDTLTGADPDSTLLTIIEEVEIPAKVDGVLATVEVKEGQMVEARDVLARIEDEEARLTLDSATIEFDIASKQAKNDLKVQIGRKSHEVAKTDLRKAENANKIKKDTVVEVEMDRLRLAADKTELETAQAIHEQETAYLTARLKETAVKVAQQAIDRRVIVSPISGMVVQVNSQAGEWVQAGKTVVRVLRLDRLRVEFFVSASRLKDKLMGRKVTLSVDLPEQPGAEFAGEIVFVSPEVDHINQSIRVWAEINNDKLQLHPGLRGKIAILEDKTVEASRRSDK
jgi:macrolide-specific efflux system membrane fusion protein